MSEIFWEKKIAIFWEQQQHISQNKMWDFHTMENVYVFGNSAYIVSEQ
jgi:hypothetical protein